VKAIAVTNQKGGVAKTTTALNLAVALTRSGLRVLVVDLDPQANLTTQAGFDIRAKRLSIYDVLVNKRPIAEVIQEGSLGFWVAPSDEVLMRAEMERGDASLGWVRDLKRALDPVRDRFDYCLFDTPPVRGFLTVNALVAADHGVIVPFVPEVDALMGMQLLLSRMEELRPSNPELRPLACVPVMVDRKWRVHRDTLDSIASHFPDLPVTPAIPRAADFPRARSMGMSIFDFAPHSIGAKRYADLARLVVKESDQQLMGRKSAQRPVEVH
jgi:chromosome partitioning protein